MKNDYEIYKQVLRNRIASLQRKLKTARGYVRPRLREQLQETRRLLNNRSEGKRFADDLWECARRSARWVSPGESR